MSIMNLLFGSKKRIETAKLGIFEAKIKNEKTAKDITWLSTVEITDYSNDITIILEGDGYGPEQKQLESATWIIENIKIINDELVSKINNDSTLNEKYRKFDLYDLRLSCLNPWEISLNSYELSFESKRNDEFAVSVIIQNEKIIKID